MTAHRLNIEVALPDLMNASDLLMSAHRRSIPPCVVGGRIGGIFRPCHGIQLTSRRYATCHTGCIESVNHGGSFLLTHVADDHQTMMAHDGMKKESGMEKNAEAAGPSDMHEDRTMPTPFALAGRMRNLETLTVASLKVVANTCK